MSQINEELQIRKAGFDFAKEEMHNLERQEEIAIERSRNVVARVLIYIAIIGTALNLIRTIQPKIDLSIYIFLIMFFIFLIIVILFIVTFLSQRIKKRIIFTPHTILDLVDDLEEITSLQDFYTKFNFSITEYSLSLKKIVDDRNRYNLYAYYCEFFIIGGMILGFIVLVLSFS